MTGPVLAWNAEQAAAALALLETCPARERATAAAPNVPVRMADLYAAAHASYPDGSRYAVDNIWTHRRRGEHGAPGRVARQARPGGLFHPWMGRL